MNRTWTRTLYQHYSSMRSVYLSMVVCSISFLHTSLMGIRRICTFNSNTKKPFGFTNTRFETKALQRGSLPRIWIENISKHWLTLFFLMFPSEPLWNIRKPFSRGIKREHWEEKGSIKEFCTISETPAVICFECIKIFEHLHISI